MIRFHWDLYLWVASQVQILADFGNMRLVGTRFSESKKILMDLTSVLEVLSHRLVSGLFHGAFIIIIAHVNNN